MHIKTFSQVDTPHLETLSRETFWQRHVSLWRDSGLSKMAYCKRYSLVYHQMIYWCGKEAPSCDEVADTASGNFVPVAIALDAQSASTLSVRVSDRIAIEGIDQHNVGLVARLLEQL